jgi:hypothetical protein
MSDLSQQSHVTAVEVIANNRSPSIQSAAADAAMATGTPHVIRYVVTPRNVSSSVNTWPPVSMPERTKTRLDRNALSWSRLTRPFNTLVNSRRRLTRPVAGRAFVIRPGNQLTVGRAVESNVVGQQSTPRIPDHQHMTDSE